ncbi:YmaF family protein [Paenibacillus puerhi]|uniref:YmaF family protein n=1 Tax=Paenibacillus puerhi TaxID=2692622 RepID=UPI0013590542|nr:YmaF family protein [Paenibacillus puerhi]
MEARREEQSGQRGIGEGPSQTSEAPALAHAHFFSTVTGVTLEHAHPMNLFTYPVNGNSRDGHVHNFQGYTLVADGHFHRFVGMTGPAVGLPNGEHYHRIISKVDDEPFLFQGNFYVTVLSIPRHVHSFNGVTSRGIGYDIDPVSLEPRSGRKLE